MTRFLLRLSLIALVAGLLAREVAAQGIYGVTRPTRTLERQATARQFFNAAGLNVTGGVPGASPSSSASALRPVTVPGAVAPVAPSTAIAAHPMAPRTARPLVLITPVKPTPVLSGLNSPTNRTVVPTKPPTLAKPSHANR